MLPIELDMIGAVSMLLALCAGLSILYKGWRNGISPTPASAPVCRAVIKEIRQWDKAAPCSVVEAGSGWGNLAVLLSQYKSNWLITGIENSWIPLWFSRLLAKVKASKNIQFIYGDLYKYSYRKADIIICYLFPGAMKKLDPIFTEQLCSGTAIISICFALPNWQPEKVIVCGDMYRTKIYIYEVKCDC